MKISLSTRIFKRFTGKQSLQSSQEIVDTQIKNLADFTRTKKRIKVS